MLAALAVVTIEIPRDVWYGSFPDLTDPIGIYINTLVNWGLWASMLSFLVPVLFVLLWGLSRRFSRKRVWQAFGAGTVLIALVMAWGDANPVSIGTAVDTLEFLAGAAGILGSMALVEYVATTDRERTSSGINTLGWVAVVVFGFMLVTAAIASAGVVLAEQTDAVQTPDELEEQHLEEQRAGQPEADGEPVTEPIPDLEYYGPGEIDLRAEDSAAWLIGDSDDDPPEPAVGYEVNETYVGGEYFDLRELEVELNGDLETVDGVYDISVRPLEDVLFRSDAVVRADTMWVRSEDGYASYSTANVPDDGDGTLRMENVRSMWVYYDVVEDGEVNRYMVYLERGDIDG